MTNRFLERGYSHSKVNLALQRAVNTNRADLLKDKPPATDPPRMCFVTEYNHCATEIKSCINKHWHILQAEPTLRDVCANQPRFAFRKAPTLKTSLMRTSPTDRSTWLSIKGNYRCGAGCACCNNTTNTTTFKHPMTGQKIPIKQFIDCKSTMCVYLLTCPCGKAYVGQTKRQLKIRISEHKTAIRTGNLDYAMAKHYAEAQHGGPSSLRFIGIERILPPPRGGDILKKLAQHEMYWIDFLNSMNPNGLNDDYSLKCFL